MKFVLYAFVSDRDSIIVTLFQSSALIFGNNLPEIVESALKSEQTLRVGESLELFCG